MPGPRQRCGLRSQSVKDQQAVVLIADDRLTIPGSAPNFNMCCLSIAADSGANDDLSQLCSRMGQGYRVGPGRWISPATYESSSKARSVMHILSLALHQSIIRPIITRQC